MHTHSATPAATLFAVPATGRPDVHEADLAAAVAQAEEARPRGCGWFDSSLDLAQGLAVIEHRGFDALPRGLPLAWQMAAWQQADGRAPDPRYLAGGAW